MGLAFLDMLEPKPQIRDESVEAAERSLAEFITQAWHTVEPETEYQDNWHIHTICDHLEAARRREIRNLLINMPPRMQKSLTVSVFFPAWVWTLEPGERFLYSSYAERLASDHSKATRRVIQSDWYQARWGNKVQLARDQNAKLQFENTAMGVRMATSVGGRAAGVGGDYVVVDDPHNVSESESETKRESVLRWWDQTMASRLNDPATGVRIIVMQRVHEDDLSGHVLEQGGYTHLNLPMEYEPDRAHYSGFGKRDPRTEEGELLSPERVGAPEVEEIKLRLGSYAYAGQYQQRPSPAGGGILKAGWWEYWEAPLPPMDWVLTAYDTAFKKGQENDYSVGLTAALSGGRIYVLDLWRDKVEFPLLKRAVHANYLKWRPDEVLVEDKASGQSLIQEMAQEVEYGRGWVGGELIPIVPWNPESDKIQRAHTASPYLEARRILLPAGAAWLDEFINEAATFPNGRHDDQVDAIVMAILRLRDRMPLITRGAPEDDPAFRDMPAA